MAEFNLEGLVFLVFVLFLLGYGLYILIKSAVKAAMKEINEEKNTK